MVRSRFALVVVAALVLAAVAPLAAVGPAAAADARLTLTDATVSPATPTAGAPITTEATVRLSAGSNTSLALDGVRVVRPRAGLAPRVLGNATDLGTLSPGETLTVPVTFTVGTPQVYDLQLVAVGTDSDGDTVRATRPLTVGVERGAPQVELRNERLVAGADSPVAAVVSNPTTGPLRGIELVVTDPATGERTRRTVPDLAAGGSSTLNLSVRPEAAGEQSLAVRTTYTTPVGVERTATFSKNVTVDPLTTDVGVRVGPARQDETDQVAGGLSGLVGGGGGSALQSQTSDDERAARESRVDVTVTNFGNAPVEDVVVRGTTPDGEPLAAVGRLSVTDTLSPGESATVTVDLSSVGAVDGVRFEAGYDAPSGRATNATVYDYSAARGNATLTGLDVSVDDDGRVSLDGNLANTGDGEVESAVVGIVPTGTVEPAYPQRTYFVGSVAASEFAPFELTAQADVANASALRVQVRYATAGERVADTVTVPLPDADGTDRGSPTQSLGIALLLTVGVVAGAAVTLYRRR